MLKIQEINIFLITLFLALGNIVWFADFTLGSLKMALIVMIVVMNVNMFLNPRNYVGFLGVVVLAPFLLMTAADSLGTVSEKVYWLYAFVENYLFLMLGYTCCVRGENVDRMLRMTVPFTVFFSLLIVGNFATGVPHWVSPIAKAAYTSAVNGGYTGGELAPMYSTGFGIARTGWATTLCSYLPLTLLFVHNRKMFYPAYILIALTAILSASRGGLFLTLLVTAVIFAKSGKGWAFKTVAMLSLVAVFLVVMPYIDGVERFLRLSGGGGNMTSLPDACRSMSGFQICSARAVSWGWAYMAHTII